MPKKETKPAAATTEEKYIRRDAAARLVFQEQAVDDRSAQIPLQGVQMDFR